VVERVEEDRGGRTIFKILDLLAVARRSQAVLGFLSTVDVGKLAPAPAEEGARVRSWSGNHSSGAREKRRRD